jgi:hypothetical protein
MSASCSDFHKFNGARGHTRGAIRFASVAMLCGQKKTPATDVSRLTGVRIEIDNDKYRPNVTEQQVH